MHDNARPHIAHAVGDYLQEVGIHVLPWPARSPDMNPIEHVWDMLERRVKNRRPRPESLQELRRALGEEWELIPQEDIANQTESMPRRMDAVIQARGGNTRYQKEFLITHKEICLGYQLNGTSVPQVNTFKYLGIYLSNKLGWEEQVTNTTRKAWKALHFSMRILKKSNRKSKELAYKTLVRPIMEYGAVGWDPYRQNQIDSIEKVQRKAAKYVKMGKGHGEEIVKYLGWELLKSRRRKTRLTALFKAQMGHKAWTDINA
ncbi:hypothetical protein ANN_27052 [Periplaneta americana]|uniref:Tc1-like transposase DDE domain-containing protein n=1 Tax=Periplaneta americana TaxID=6978 RepID=A0ABQ8RXH9_PERAM|nr:hypothetical protein ANN_27052 [Periplaneta americana]